MYAGTVTTLGSSAFRNFIPDHDSEMVVRLKRAGLETRRPKPKPSVKSVVPEPR